MSRRILTDAHAEHGFFTLWHLRAFQTKQNALLGKPRMFQQKKGGIQKSTAINYGIWSVYGISIKLAKLTKHRITEASLIETFWLKIHNKNTPPSLPDHPFIDTGASLAQFNPRQIFRSTSSQTKSYGWFRYDALQNAIFLWEHLYMVPNSSAFAPDSEDVPSWRLFPRPNSSQIEDLLKILEARNSKKRTCFKELDPNTGIQHSAINRLSTFCCRKRLLSDPFWVFGDRCGYREGFRGRAVSGVALRSQGLRSC